MDEPQGDPISREEALGAATSDPRFEGPVDQPIAGTAPAWLAGPSRPLAIFEVLAVSGMPTQAAITALLLVLRMPMRDEHGLLSLTFFATLSLVDTVAVVWMIGYFLLRAREHPGELFLGRRPVAGEIARGIGLVPVVILGVGGVVLGLRQIAPWMHTVERNPLEDFIGTPLHTAIFMVVVVVAGGVREELQRAFILHRFEQRLGGATVGLLLFSVLFGLLHLMQGVDVALAIGTLGLVWGIIFLRRRSAVLPMANHASFNALQVMQVVLARSFGA